MSQLPDLISVALRPILMLIFAALVYKVAKLFIATNRAAILSFSSTTGLFIIELVSIQIPALQFASMLSTLVGAGLLAMIFWRKRKSQN